MVQLFAHRGSHREHPENTLSAFGVAIEEGADGVELDVRTCASGEVVVCHDPTLERLAGRPLSVARTPWRALRDVDLGGERIPLLDAVLDRVLGAGLAVNVEVKGDVPRRRAAAAAVLRLLGRRRAEEREAVLLSTFDPVVLFTLCRGAPEVRIGFLFDAAHTKRWRAALIARALRSDGLHPHHALCSPGRVARWRRRGYYVNAWTVNEPRRARRLAAAGVDAIITDDVPTLRAALR